MYAIPTHNNPITHTGQPEGNSIPSGCSCFMPIRTKKFFIYPFTYLRIEFSFAIMFP